jgi:3-oxoacyl-[acyl-carrier protein] reductase
VTVPGGLSLDGQVHVVVGGARGIGAACAALLAARGARVAVLDLDEDAARQTAAGLGEGATGGRVDIADEGSASQAVADAVRDHGKIDGLVNCAGITGATGMQTHEVDPDDFDLVYRINLRGAFLVSRAVLPLMVEAGYGRLVHVASISGKEGNAGMAAYSCTKAGLIGLVKVMGKEYARTGVTVNAVAPAVIRTPMVEALPQQQVDYMTERIPMGRTGTLEEIAELVAWIASPASSFTTGFTFDLSGGRATY